MVSRVTPSAFRVFIHTGSGCVGCSCSRGSALRDPGVLLRAQPRLLPLKQFTASPFNDRLTRHGLMPTSES